MLMLSGTHTISACHRGRQVIHDSLLCNKSQITRPLCVNKDNNAIGGVEYTLPALNKFTNQRPRNYAIPRNFATSACVYPSVNAVELATPKK